MRKLETKNFILEKIFSTGIAIKQKQIIVGLTETEEPEDRIQVFYDWSLCWIKSCDVCSIGTEFFLLDGDIELTVKSEKGDSGELNDLEEMEYLGQFGDTEKRDVIFEMTAEGIKEIEKILELLRPKQQL